MGTSNSPEPDTLLTNGDFRVQRTSYGFSQNKSTKPNGGLVGFSLRKGAVQQRMLTAHSCAAFIDKCQEMTTDICESQPRLYKETGSARMRREIRKDCFVLKGRVLLGSTVFGWFGWLSLFVFYWVNTIFNFFNQLRPRLRQLKTIGGIPLTC